MEERVKSLSRHLIESFIIFFIGVFTSLFYCENCFTNFSDGWKIMLYSGILWLVLWKGNEWLTSYPNRFIPWKNKPNSRLLLGVVAHIIYTLFASYVLNQIFEYLLLGRFESFSLLNLISSNLTAVIIALLISLFFTARQFLYTWRDLAVENEQLKLESMSSRFASLKAQVNPHFLFNSLNVLSSLVYKDPDLSAQFIHKLADVYRYVLDRQEDELVPIQEELEFIKSYIFLQQMRFGKSLTLKNDISENSDLMIAPLALQMLIENAIKHNIISEESPLEIQLAMEEEHFIISNKMRKKKTGHDSLGIGLENIQNRYKYLSKNPVEIYEKRDEFIVKLPIIKAA